MVTCTTSLTSGYLQIHYYCSLLRKFLVFVIILIPPFFIFNNNKIQKIL